ncbi:MAG: hypothetical protein QOG64_3133 [Acidimicrobiaceae bacterium]|nr:hypothetical protein [Acidimicrobiaceae bacterium]
MRLARYVRTGGPPPAQDEWLDIDDSGRFDLVRTVGSRRVGHFAGTLPDRDVTELAALAAAVGDDELSVKPSMPQQTLEIVRTAKASATTTVEAARPAPWQALTERLRTLTEDLTGSPVSAVALQAGDGERRLRLEAVGTEPVELDWNGASIEFALFGADEEWLESGFLPVPDGVGAGAHEPGWAVEVPLDGAPSFTPDQIFDLRVTFTMVADGAPKKVQLATTLGRGWFPPG